MTTLYHLDDVDGDKISVFDAEIPGIGAGVNIRTSPTGASIPASEIPRLIRALAMAVPGCAFVGKSGDSWCVHTVANPGDVCDDHKTITVTTPDAAPDGPGVTQANETPDPRVATPDERQRSTQAGNPKRAPRNFTCPCGRGTGYITKAAARAASSNSTALRCGLQAWHPVNATPTNKE